MKIIELFTKNLSGNARAVLGLTIISIVILAAIFAPLISPYGPDEQDITQRLNPPSAEHILGTDNLGRDIFTRIIYGARISILVGVLSVAFSGTIGIILGLIAGYFRTAGTVIMRIVDIFLAIPYVLFAVVLIAALGPGLKNVIIAMAVTRWVQYARVVYGQVLSIKEQEFIEGECAPNLGARHRSIVPIPGKLPDILNLPIGCRFAPRCERRITDCTEMTDIPLKKIGSSHFVRCINI